MRYIMGNKNYDSIEDAVEAFDTMDDSMKCDIAMRALGIQGVSTIDRYTLECLAIGMVETGLAKDWIEDAFETVEESDGYYLHDGILNVEEE